MKLIEEDGERARFLKADLTVAADVDRLATEAGDVDVLVNNAGRSWFGPSAAYLEERHAAPPGV